MTESIQRLETPVPDDHDPRAVYQHGDRVELRHNERSPWVAKATIVSPTLSAVGTGLAPQWMVRGDGQHGSYAVPGVCIRRLVEGRKDGGPTA